MATVKVEKTESYSILDLTREQASVIYALLGKMTEMSTYGGRGITSEIYSDLDDLDLDYLYIKIEQRKRVGDPVFLSAISVHENIEDIPEEKL